MADSKTRVLTVDTGKAINNVKEFKQHIEDLKGVLLTLEKGTEEYSTVAKELRESQDKLNEVMDVAKGRGEAVSGSYDNLVATMRELKKQWRATADEAERTDLGKQILDINNQLKDLDASTGNFQRNVGDYENAFSKAFDKILGGISQSDGALAGLAGRIKNLIPVIKSINNTAITGLKGIKRAIAATGIGILVVAVGELAANWDKVKNALGGVFGKQNDLVKEIERSKKAMEDYKREIEYANSAIRHQINLLAARGATTIEQIQEEIRGYEELRDDANKQYLRVREWLFLYSEASGVDVESKKEKAKELETIINDYNTKIIEANRRIEVEQAKLRKQAEDLNESSKKALMSRAEQLRLEWEEDKRMLESQGVDVTNRYRKYLKDLADLAAKNKVSISDVVFNTNSSDYDKIKTQIDGFFVKVTDEVTKSSNRAYVIASDNLKKQLEKGEISYIGYFSKVNELNRDYVKKSGEERLQLTKEALKKEYDINKANLNKGEEDEIKQVDKIANKRKDELFKYLKEGKISQKTYDEEIVKLENQTLSEKTKIHERYNETIDGLNRKFDYENQEAELKIFKETIDKKIELLTKEKNIADIQVGLDFDTRELEQRLASKSGGLSKFFGNLNTFNIFSNEDIDAAFELVQDRSKALYENNKVLLEQSISEYETLISQLDAGSVEAFEAQQSLSNAKIELQTLETNRIIELQDEVDEHEQALAERRQLRLTTFMDGINSISSLMSNFASLQQQQIQQEVANGKISEGEAKKRFEQTKKVQVAAAYMEMGSGIVGAISQAYQNLPPFIAPIYAAINSAAVIASSMLRINQIKQQQLNGGSSTSTSTPNVNQVVNEFTPQYTQNVTTDGELTNLSNAMNNRPLYVSVTDINDVQNKVKVIENETSY